MEVAARVLLWRPGMGEHDSLFKRVFRLPKHAAGELRSVLPPELLHRIDLGTLELVPTSFVSPELRERFVDALFRARFRDTAVPGYVGVLIEHQSQPDLWLPLRALEYYLRAWTELLRKEPARRSLPPIVCVVVHHGTGGWTAPRSLQGLIDGLAAAPELAPYVPSFEILVDDLCHQSDESLASRPLGPLPKVALWLLRDGRNIDTLLDHLEAWKDELGRLVDSEASGAQADDVIAVMRYILSVAGPRPFAEVKERVVRAVPVTEAPMASAAEQLIQEGIRRGERTGKAEGKAESVLAVLTAREVSVSAEERAQILACADLGQLERWLRVAMTAERAADLFAR